MIAHSLLHLLSSRFETFKDMVIHTAEVTDDALSVNAVIYLLQQHINNKKLQSLNGSSSTALTVQISSTGPTGCFKQPICVNGKHNSVTQHDPNRCWQLHPNLFPSNTSNSANLVISSSIIPPTPPTMTTYLLATFSKTSNKFESILDSGASTPIITSQYDFKMYSDHVEDVNLADGTEIRTQGRRSLEMKGKDYILQLTNCLHIPTLAPNLISLSYLFQQGCQLV